MDGSPSDMDGSKTRLKGPDGYPIQSMTSSAWLDFACNEILNSIKGLGDEMKE
jgi:hypothetical protein